MRTQLAVLVLACGVLASACGKKSSREFFEAQRQYESLVTQQGEDAYLTAEMEQVSSALAAVPARALEYEKAQELVAKIAAERGRIERERAEAARAEVALKPETMPEMPPSLLGPPPGAEKPAQAAGPVDETPTAGMPEATFREQYAACIGARELMPVAGVGEVPAYPVKDSAECQKRMGVTGQTRFFFVNGGLAGRASKETTRTTRVVDGGAPVVINPPQQFLLVPGAPLPAGLGGAPPPAPAGTMAPAGTGSGMEPVNAAGGLQPRENP